ncbi:MAG: hypothetical protein EHM64_15670 [Ignavibacteriae bacterium]|nr:MAG: hypothetical protein EHM64_15670 [Ignavibacteriota bacterium]
MAGVYELNYKGKLILCLDVAGLKLKDKLEFQKHVEDAKEQIRKFPPKSLLIITNVTDTGFDTQVAAIMGEYADHNTPYVKASALVGIAGVQRVVLAAIKAMIGRDFFIAGSMEEAQEWLIQQ